MGKIKDIPIYNRPREKAYRLGIEQLADYELLAIIINQGVSNYSALEIAFHLIDDHHGMKELAKLDYQDLLAYRGLGKVSAIKLAAIFELMRRITYEEDNLALNKRKVDSEYLYLRYKDVLSKETQERLMLIGVDAQYKMVFEKEIFIGSESDMPASTQPILASVLRHNCKNFYLIHNHPGENPDHSQSDIVFLNQLSYEAKRLNLKVITSIVISNEDYSIYQPK